MNTDLNSALALFQSLYKAQKGDVYTIIEQFILVGVKSKGLMSFTNEEIIDLLKSTFNIDIPFSVIQKCINSNQKVFKYSHGKYVVINPMDEEIDKIIEEMNGREAYMRSIISELVVFAEEKKSKTMTEEEKVDLSRLFSGFLVDKDKVVDVDDRLLITQFIIEKEGDERFQAFLNSIREGMVIYKGIRYTDSPNDTSWEYNTDFFLDQEYLFSAYGMNGPFYENCFFEFYNLLEEINKASNSRGGRRRIRLFFFPETKDDMDAYFAQAIRIRRMQERYIYPQIAMDTILNACREDVDIERYKTNFYRRLKDLHISEYQDEIDLRKNQDFLFESDDFEKKKEEHFTPDQYPELNSYIKIADYINIMRQGKRNYPMERCGYMFLSDGNLSNELSRFIRDYYSERKPLVITRMGTFTELMWFKLRKGVVGTDCSATISVVNKAKTIVSGLLNDNLRKQYTSVLEMEADESEKLAFYADLRSKRCTPDEINSETIAEDIAFIDNTDYLEKYKETQDLLRKQASKAGVLEIELEQEKAEKQRLIDKVVEFEEYVKKDNKRKMMSAINSARNRIRKKRFWLKSYAWIANVLVILAFLIPTILCMDLTWANIATVGGFFIATETVINGWLLKRKNKVRESLQKRYKVLILDELDKLGM